MGGQAMVTADGGATNSVLWKLTHLLTGNNRLQMDVRRKIVHLKEELESLHAFLLSISEMGDSEERVRSWMVEAREVSYDIEDILDGELLKSDHQLPDFQGFIEQSMSLLTVIENRRHITGGVKELFMSPYWDFLFELNYSPLDSGSTSAQGPWEKQPEKPVGIDTLSDRLLNLLIKADDELVQKLRVISIVGCEGLGKTTLAKEVYRKLEQQFKCRAFVSMTPEHSMSEILKKIMYQVSQQEFDDKRAWGEQQLISTLRKFLEDKRYFVVVDDVKSALSWRIIKEALPENKLGSRIMTTTCINSIANTCCPHVGDVVYEMKPLTFTDSESLFLSIVSGSEVAEVYDSILKLCGYTPLAIISLSSMLAKKESTRESWEEVRNSLRFSPGNISGLEDRIHILSRSYYDLPSNLKACALYLSILPVNHKIDRDWLVRKWIAEGFVYGEGDLSPEDVAKRYLDMLINMNFIQPADYSRALVVEAYQVQFMMHYLLKSLSQQENFVTLLHARAIQNSDGKTIRRLSIYYPNREDSVGAVSMKLSHVRSLAVFGGAKQIAFKEFEKLRVLDLEGCKGLEDANMTEICCMLLLKYLGLKETQISKLPQQIRDLQHLETLDVRKTKIRDLPKEAVQLRKLVNLLVGDSDTHQGLKFPEGIKVLTSLKVLCTIDLRENSSNILQELGKLTELRELEIVLSYDGPTDNKQTDEILSSLVKCTNLQSLVVYGDFICSMKTQLEFYPRLLQKLRVTRRFAKCPLWIAKLIFLRQLEIRVCKLEDDDLGILRDLPSLQRLLLGLEILPKSQSVIISNEGFLSLDTFCFDCKMPWVRFQEGAMKKLKHLELKFYGGLATQIPGGTTQLRSLQKVVLQYPQGCERDAGIKETIDAMEKEANEHVNWITMYRNGKEGRFPWNVSADKGKRKIDG